MKWIVLCSLLVLAACSEPNQDGPQSTGVHPGQWNDTRWLLSDRFHGDFVLSQGTGSCLACHGTDLQGYDAGIPGCFTCHFGPDGSRTPPDSAWVHGRADHERLEAFQEACNACHDVGQRFGTGPLACHNCHGPGADHVLGQAWLDKKSQLFHGDSVSDSCAECHVLSQKCFTCHFGPGGSLAPPGSGWHHGNNNAHREYSADAAVCNQCHRLNRSYGNPPRNCHDCHGDGDDD